MTREDQFIEQLEGYLDEFEGNTPLPDAVRENLRAEIPSTRQVGSSPGPMKHFHMSLPTPIPARYGLVAAAVLTATILGNAFLTGREVDNIAAEPTATEVAPTLIAPNFRGVLAAGVHYVDAPFPVSISFELPEGIAVFWYTSEGSQLNLSDRGAELSFEIVDNVTADPCTPELLDPPVGPSVEDLVAVLSNLPEFDATAATDVAIDGFRGRQFTLTAPIDGPCDSMSTWKTTTRQNRVGPGEINEVTILDVDGVRVLMSIAYQQSETPAVRSRLRAIADSVQIGP